MKNLLFLLLLCTSSLPAGAQPWFSQNPVWVNYFSFGFAGAGTETLSVAGDTTLLGLSAVKIKRVRKYNSGQQSSDLRVLRQTGDTIWVWNNNGNSFIRMYDFTLPVGAIFNMPYYYGTKIYTYKIDSIATLQLSGQTSRIQYLSSDAAGCGKAKVIEKIGAVSFGCRQHFFLDEPDEAFVDGPSRILCSYQSANLAYAGSESLCRTVAVNQPKQADALLVSPNPTGGLLRVVSNTELPTGFPWRLSDACSRPVLEGIVKQDALINLEQVPAGIYILHLHDKVGRVVAAKIVKQ